MQSPLTPQRGRIDSNPREYTHMGPSTNLPHERGFSDTRAWIFRRPPDERGFSDEIDRQKPKTVQISTRGIFYLSSFTHL